MRVDQAEFSELVTRPFIGALHVRRTGQAGANLFKQSVGKLHDFRIMKSLVADLVDHVEINLLLGERTTCAGKCKNGNETDGQERPAEDFHVFSWFKKL